MRIKSLFPYKVKKDQLPFQIIGQFFKNLVSNLCQNTTYTLANP